MLLSELLKNVKHKKTEFDAEVTSLSADSRACGKGSAFFCMNGKYAAEACKNGAAAIIGEGSAEFPNFVSVDNIKDALSVCCDNFYGNPSEKLRFIGITGTNGKTTTTHMIRHILSYCGRNTGIIGTNGNYAGKRRLPETGFTTPEPVQMYSLFSEMVNEQAEYCVMEVSSQSLSQGRCRGLRFETAAFLNLSGEHLDYHGDMKSYALAKAQLFENAGKCVLNIDDGYYDFFRKRCRTALTFSVKSKQADLFADNVNFSGNRVSYTLISGNMKCLVSLNGQGIYTVSNSLAAIGCCVFSGISVEKCAEALKSFQGVEGRCEFLNINAPFSVMTDYAHTPDAVRSVLSGIRSAGDGRIISLFGCGGDRDKSKRPLMMRAAAEYSDYVVITSDNPRSENPFLIIKDVLSGLDRCEIPFAVIENREKAIHFALSEAREGDTVALLGKGHEKYIVRGSGKTEFDERKIVYNALKMNKY